MPMWGNEGGAGSCRKRKGCRRNQLDGQTDAFEDYTITIVAPMRRYILRNRAEAPAGPNLFPAWRIVLLTPLPPGGILLAADGTGPTGL